MCNLNEQVILTDRFIFLQKIVSLQNANRLKNQKGFHELFKAVILTVSNHDLSAQLQKSHFVFPVFHCKQG